MSNTIARARLLALAERIVRWRRPSVRAYALAIAAVTISAALRFAVQPAIGEQLYFITFLPAVVVAAALGGMKAGAVSTILSMVTAMYFFMPPFYSFEVSKLGIPQLGLFLVAAAFLVAVAGLLNSVVDLLLQQRDMIAQDTKRQAEQHHLLIRELDHRMRNLFAMVQLIAARTFQVPAEVRQVFYSRILALAKASEAPLGRHETFSELLDRHIVAYAEQINIARCDHVELSTDASLRLSLIVHELTTNAAKYGALSTKEGRISIECAIDGSLSHDRTLSFRWTESRGPKVGKPVKMGFGNVVLKGAPEHAGGRVSIDYAEEGLRYVYTAKLSSVAATN